MTSETVCYRVAAGVATITLNRPERLNALNLELRAALQQAVLQAGADTAVRAVVVTGAGEAFCVGGDLREMTPELRAQRGPDYLQRVVHPLLKAMREMDKPVLAAVNGVAAGGGAGLALMADLVLLADSARLAFTFGRLGLVPDWGLLWTLPRRVGEARAKALVWGCRTVMAPEALAIGLADEVVPAAALAGRAVELAEQLASASRQAVAMSKDLLQRAQGLSLADLLALEAGAQASCLAGPDHREGLAAFREKRAPRFSDSEGGQRNRDLSP